MIFELKGPITLDHGDLERRDRLPAVLQAEKVKIILNLKDVTGIDSTGLGTLVFGLTSEQAAVNSFFPDRTLKPFDILDFVEREANPASKQGISRTSRLIE